MKKIYLAPLLLLILTSCSDRGRNNDQADPVVVATETSHSEEILSKRKYGEDLVEKLYDQKLKSSKELADLEKAIDNARQYDDSTKAFYEYDGKSSSYYRAANSRTGYIKDSLLRERINRILTTSSDKYASLVSHHKSLLQQIGKNEERIDDLHAAIKVLVTLPDIQNYQQKNLPSPTPLHNAAAKQKSVITKMEPRINQ